MRSLLINWMTQKIAANRKAESKAIPYVELAEKHIANLKIVTDRTELLKRMPQNATVAEVGVDQGHFTSEILKITTPEKLHLIDAWGSERYGDPKAKSVADRFANEIEKGQVQITRGLSGDVLEDFPADSFDWVYIDSSHGYKVTAQELELCHTRVRSTGIITGHDYVTGNWDDGYRYGVVEAVHEFCVKRDWQLLYLTHETHRHLSFAIGRL